MKVNENTGEVMSGFRSMWCNPFGSITQDLSNEFEEVYQEIPAYAVDPKTGEFLNNSSVPKIISVGKVNVQEKIQSFAKETDLYSILEKFAYSGDMTLLNARDCSFADISELPNDLNGFAQYTRSNFMKLKNMNPELADMILDESKSAEDIESKAKEIYNERIEASKVKVEAQKGE